MAHRITPQPQFIQQPPSSLPPQANDPAWYQRVWRWGTSTTVAPLGWGGAAATEAALARAAEIFQNNEGEIVSRIQGTVNQALLRQAPAAFEEAQGAIRQFLDAPHSAHLATLQGLLAQISVDQHPSVYQAVSEEGKERVKTLSPVLQGLVAEEEAPQVPLEASLEAPLAVDAATREHIQDVNNILSFAIMQYTGSLVSASQFINTAVIAEITRASDHLVDRLNQLVERVEQVPQRAISNLSSPPQQGAVPPIAPPAGAENIPPPAPVAGGVSPLEGVMTEITRAGDHLVDRLNQLVERVEYAPQRAVSNLFSPPQQGAVPPIAPPAGAENIPPPAPAAEGVQPPASAAAQAQVPPVSPQAQVPPVSPQTQAPPVPPRAQVPPVAAQAQEGSISYEAILNQTGSLLSQIMGTAGQALSQRAAGSLATMMVFVFDKIKTHLGQNPEHQHIVETIDPLIRRVNAVSQNGSWTELIATLLECKRVMQDQQVYLQNFRLPLSSVRPSLSAIPAFDDNITDHNAVLHGSEAPTAITSAMVEHEALKLQTRASSYGPVKFICEWILKLEPNDVTYASLISIPENTAPSEWNDLFKTRFYAMIDQSDSFLLTKWVAKITYKVLLFISSFFTEALVFNGIAAFQKWQNAPQDRLNPKEIQIIQQMKNWLAIFSASYNEAAATPLGQVRDFQQMLEKAIQAPERNGGLSSSELYKAFSLTVMDTFGPRFQWRKSITQYYSAQIPSTSALYFLNPLLTALNLFCTWTINALLFIPEWIANTLMSWGTKLFLKSSPFLENSLNRTVDSLKSNTPTAYALNRIVYRQLRKVRDSLKKNLNADTHPEGLQNPCSTSKKLEISHLVEYLFEVLNKSRYGTQDRLRAYLEGRVSIRARVETEIDELFFPEALEGAVDMISLSFDALMTEGSLNQLLFDSLALVNGSMDAEEPVSDEEFTGLEKGIRDLTDEILQASIFYALGEKFDFAGEQQKAGVHQFTEDLKEQSRQVITTVNQNVGQVNPNDPFSVRGLRLLRSAVEDSVSFQRGRIDALSRADGNRSFHTETKQKLNETSQELVTHYTPIATCLNQSLQTYEESIKLNEAGVLFNLMEQSLNHVGSIMGQRGIQISQVLQGKAHFETLINLLTRLRPLSPVIGNQEPLNVDKNQLQTAVSQVETARREIDHLMQTITTQDSHPQVGRMINESTRRLEAAQALIVATAQRLRGKIITQRQLGANRVQENHGTLQGHFEQLAQHLQTFGGWITRVHDIPIWNFFVFDMQWVTELTKNLAFSRSRQKVRELTETFHQRPSYLGMLHHLGCLPFIEKYGPSHLRQS